MQITVRIKTVYGIETVYPICPKAKIFAALAGTKTLTGNSLMHIKSLGYTLAVDQPEFTI
jgi:hypothetical protein